MYSYELSRLIEEYENATSKEDIIIKMKLDNILSIHKQCEQDESVFVNEITNEFCRLIAILKEQHQKELANIASTQNNLSYTVKSEQQNFISYRTDEMPYCSDEALMYAFYEHFKDKMVEVTLRDYMARIYTFTNRYLFDIPHVKELWEKEPQGLEPIMFTYKHLEFILARFDTKGENASKQKVNLRSALRKLNQFKCAETTTVADSTDFALIRSYTKRVSDKTDLVIPEGVTEIKYREYDNRGDIMTVKIPGTVTKIAEYPFWGCSRLLDIKVSEDNKHFDHDSSGSLVSKDKTKLLRAPTCFDEVYEIAEGVRHIAHGAIEGLRFVEEIIIPDSVVEIGDFAFANCINLKKIRIPKNVKHIGKKIFKGCTRLEYIEVDNENEHYANDCQGALHNKDMTILISVPAITMGTFDIDCNVTDIAMGAFENCSGLKTVICSEKLLPSARSAVVNCKPIPAVLTDKEIK